MRKFVTVVIVVVTMLFLLSACNDSNPNVKPTPLSRSFSLVPQAIQTDRPRFKTCFRQDGKPCPTRGEQSTKNSSRPKPRVERPINPVPKQPRNDVGQMCDYSITCSNCTGQQLRSCLTEKRRRDESFGRSARCFANPDPSCK
jgi:hypothetical protein